MSDKKNLPVITISRQYAAYGRTVARALSQRLGIEYYDKDFVHMTAEKSGFSEDDIRREGEDMSSGAKLMNSFLSLNTTGSFTSSYDAIFQAQRDVILDLAKKSSILIGRCANVILQEEGIESFDIFLYADKEFRLKHAAELGENGKMNLEKYLDRRDNWRSTYYRVYTGRDLGLASDYNICLDVGRIGVDRCIDILVDILENL